MFLAFGLLLTACLASVQASVLRLGSEDTEGASQSYTSTTASARTVTSEIAAAATGISTESTTSNASITVNCTAPNALYDESCWGTLNVSDWLLNWNQTVKRCGSEDTPGVECCMIDEAWVTCFLRLAHKAPVGRGCGIITQSGCVENDFISVDTSILPQVRYVNKNIYCEHIENFPNLYMSNPSDVAINNFFSSYWTALKLSLTPAQLSIQSIVLLLDPEHKTNMFLGDILTSISFALAFLALPEVAEIQKGTQIAKAILVSQYMLIATQETPMLLRAAFPRGLYTTRQFQIGEFSQGLTEIEKQVQSTLEAWLETVMTDVPSFIHFVESGAFSGDQDISLPEQTRGLDLALKTYVVTKAMTENHWFVTYDLSYNLEDIPRVFECQYDQNLICGETMFYSNATGITYFLRFAGNPDRGLPVKNLLTQIVNDGWSDPAFMFDSAFNCTSSGAMMEENHDPEGYTMFAFKDNKFNLACASQLMVCKGCNSPCPTPLLDEGVCPFQACPVAGGPPTSAICGQSY